VRDKCIVGENGRSPKAAETTVDSAMGGTGQSPNHHREHSVRASESHQSRVALYGSQMLRQLLETANARGMPSPPRRTSMVEHQRPKGGVATAGSRGDFKAMLFLHVSTQPKQPRTRNNWGKIVNRKFISRESIARMRRTGCAPQRYYVL
jgi:hypothetical protein